MFVRANSSVQGARGTVRVRMRAHARRTHTPRFQCGRGRRAEDRANRTSSPRGGRGDLRLPAAPPRAPASGAPVPSRPCVCAELLPGRMFALLNAAFCSPIGVEGELTDQKVGPLGAPAGCVTKFTKHSSEVRSSVARCRPQMRVPLAGALRRPCGHGRQDGRLSSASGLRPQQCTTTVQHRSTPEWCWSTWRGQQRQQWRNAPTAAPFCFPALARQGWPGPPTASMDGGGVDFAPPWAESLRRCSARGVTRLHGAAQVNSILSTETSMESGISGYGIPAPLPAVSTRPPPAHPQAHSPARSPQPRAARPHSQPLPVLSVSLGALCAAFAFLNSRALLLRKARARGLETECKLRRCPGGYAGTTGKSMVVQFGDTLMGLAGSVHPKPKTPAFMLFRTRQDQFNS